MSRINKNDRVEVTFDLNGVKVHGWAESRMLLSDFLRHEIGATGTHVGCEHGVCGACTVHLNGRTVRSCLTLAVQADGTQVSTIEGMAEPDGELGILQRAFKSHFALQCGFCTPGIIMSLADYLSHVDTVNEDDIRQLVSGHLCRCTGYTPIIKAALHAANEIFEARNKAGKQVNNAR